MSQERLDALRAGFDAFNRRDADAMASLTDPGITFEAALVGTPTYRGHEGIRRMLKDVDVAWERLRSAPDDISFHDDVAVMTYRLSGRGRTSGAEIEGQLVWGIDFRGEKIVRVREFANRSEALVAAGLSEQAMSEENVELLHQGVAAWNRCDLDGYLELFDPEIEWRPGATRVEGGAYRGREGIRRFWSDVYATFDELVTSLEEVREAGDMVVGLGRLRGRSKGGVPVDTPYGLVLRYRDGLIVSGSDWFSHTEALEAAGLRE
jgi:ketosteroid isomerase-like protein